MDSTNVITGGLGNFAPVFRGYLEGFLYVVSVCLFACLFLMIQHTGFESIKLAHTVGVFCKCLLGARHCPRLRYSDEECFFILDLHLSICGLLEEKDLLTGT